ncbi:hypothetical protein GCM10009733_007920 [Nonomuraea maheshkhaliensis]|uniref:Uncharacterized protein n=1 Tax=Nonomuraea maheshkhaliensis TaxID=419590 RepID=A0ABP4QKL7_9ACTN
MSGMASSSRGVVMRSASSGHQTAKPSLIGRASYAVPLGSSLLWLMLASVGRSVVPLVQGTGFQAGGRPPW